MKNLIHTANPLNGELGVIVSDSNVTYEGNFVMVHHEDSTITYPSHCILYVEQITDDEFEKREKAFQDLEEARTETEQNKLEG